MSSICRGGMIEPSVGEILRQRRGGLYPLGEVSSCAGNGAPSVGIAIARSGTHSVTRSGGGGGRGPSKGGRNGALLAVDGSRGRAISRRDGGFARESRLEGGAGRESVITDKGDAGGMPGGRHGACALSYGLARSAMSASHAVDNGGGCAVRGSGGKEMAGSSFGEAQRSSPLIGDGDKGARRREKRGRGEEKADNSISCFSASAVCSMTTTTTTTTTMSNVLPGHSKVEIPDPSQGQKQFFECAEKGNVVPLYRRIMSDCLTPVLAYRCLVDINAHDHPSMLFESVEDGTKAGRYSIIGTEPDMEIVAKEDLVTVLDHVQGTRHEAWTEDPLSMPAELSKQWNPVFSEGLPACFTGGWVGYTSYDTVRYVEKKKLSFGHAPEDDRALADVHLGLYNSIVVFDHVTKIIFVVRWVHLENYPSVQSAYEDGNAKLEQMVGRLENGCNGSQFQVGYVDLKLAKHGSEVAESNMSKEEFIQGVEKSKEHILAGDIFQLVLSQRFERRTFVTPFEVYRALRVVNPSPYMIYMQARGCILVASSPEILCRINNRTVVNRPLAGTRPRGTNEEEDARLEKDLLADEKECAEHVMLVDLGRNDVGKVSKAGTVKVEKLMEVERYSHVMHISSTVTGELLDEMSCWDALRAALPVGTVSGAPKVRAMELIDELEPSRRGPYAGGIGAVSYKGNMDIALALRTMVFPTFGRYDAMLNYKDPNHRREWLVHLQAGAGLVADSDPETEYQETVNKAAALARAIDLAETAFLAVPQNHAADLK